jgi:hypothetical protein
MDSSASGRALTGAISISQRRASPLTPQSSFNFVEVTDLDQDPAGFFGCMIEGFVKATPGMSPTPS